MKLDLSEMARIPGSYAEHEINMTFKEVEGMTLTAPVHGNMTISSTGQVLLLEGTLDTEIEMVCYRCGCTYRQPIHGDFQEEFVVRPAQAPGKGPRVEEGEEMPDVRLFFEGTLDLNLDELLRQSILLALPLKPLCADDCQGLCPKCGHRLSEGPCGCAPETASPQLAVLREVWERKRRQ